MSKDEIILLCHGRKSDKKKTYPYFENAIHIDVSKQIIPDIIYDLKKGLPDHLPSAKLIQSVTWPNLLFPFTQNNANGIKLINDVYNNLQHGGYFIFNYLYNPRYDNIDFLIEYLQSLGFVFTNYDDVENNLNISLFTSFSLFNEQNNIVNNNTEFIIKTISSYVNQKENVLSSSNMYQRNVIDFVCKKN